MIDILGHVSGGPISPSGNVNAWDIRSCHQQHDFPVGQHYKVTMSVYCHKKVGARPDVTLEAART